MQFEGALIKEQGVTFAVITVKPHVIRNRATASQASIQFERFFPGVPIVLMAQDERGVPTYLGRPDLAKFLANCHISQLPWRRYTFS